MSEKALELIKAAQQAGRRMSGLEILGFSEVAAAGEQPGVVGQIKKIHAEGGCQETPLGPQSLEKQAPIATLRKAAVLLVDELKRKAENGSLTKMDDDEINAISAGVSGLRQSLASVLAA